MPTKLRKVTRTLFKDQFGTGSAQIVAASVTGAVKVYKQGATANASVTVTSGTSVAVRDSGRIKAGDTVQNGTSSSLTATVDSVTSRTAIVLTKVGGTGPSFVSGDRIVVTSDRPTLYSESSGGGTVGSSNVDTGTDGVASFYSTEGVVDIIYSGTGISTSSEYDVEAGYVSPHPWLDVRDFASLKEAYDAAPSTGATIHIPANTTVTLSAALDVSKPVVFLGDGAATGSKIQASAADPNHHLFNVTTGAQFRGLEIDMRATVADSYDCFRIHGHGVNNIDVANIQMYDVYIHHVPRNALRITEIIDSHFEKVLISQAYGDGIVIQKSSGGTDPPTGGGYTVTNNTNLVFIDCRVTDSHKRGVYHTDSYRTNIIGCTFEGLGEAASTGGAGGTTGTGASDGLVYIANAISPTIIGCHSEGAFTGGTRAQQFWYVEAMAGGTFTGNAIELVNGDTGPQLAPLYGVLFQTCGDSFIGGNRILGFTTQSIVVANDSPRMVLQQPNYGTSTDRMLISHVNTTLIGGLGVKVPEFANNTARDHATTGAYTLNGTIIYNAASGKIEAYAGGTWVPLH